MKVLGIDVRTIVAVIILIGIITMTAVAMSTFWW